MNATEKVPVAILTGFLGSGKTTLLNHILTVQHGWRIAVIENEYGEVDIDSALVVSSEEDIYEMTNGCVCCVTSVRNDVLEVVSRLTERDEPFDYILIETSGLADPMPVAQAFFVDHEVLERVSLDAIITMVDAKHIEARLDETTRAGVDNQAVDQIVCADRIIVNKIDLVDDATVERVEARVRALNQTAEIVRSTRAAVDLDRILGIRAFELSQRAVPPSFLDDDHHHAHDPEVGSVSVEFGGELDEAALVAHLEALVADRGPDLFRLKGILNLAGEDRQIVLQGVHDTFELYPLRPWTEADDRTNRVVAIGRGLSRPALAAGFASCLVVPGEAVVGRR